MRCMKGGFTVMDWSTGSVRPFVFEESTRFAHGEAQAWGQVAFYDLFLCRLIYCEGP